MRRLPGLALVVACAAPLAGWHNPVHEKITNAALAALPEAERARFGTERDALAKRYSLLPDMCAGMPEEQSAPLKVYCETPDGMPIHNVTWKPNDDRRAIEYSLGGIVNALRAGDTAAAARHAGVLSHFLADSTCPSHALIPIDSSLAVLYPPPPGKGGQLTMHREIEASAPDFGSVRAPARAGKMLREAAEDLLARTYRAIRENRERLGDVVQAYYENDEAALNRERARTALAGAELVADALHTSMLLAAN